MTKAVGLLSMLVCLKADIISHRGVAIHMPAFKSNRNKQAGGGGGKPDFPPPQPLQEPYKLQPQFQRSGRGSKGDAEMENVAMNMVLLFLLIVIIFNAVTLCC